MPDLLAHVFIAYALCGTLSWRYDWLTAPYITVGMVGAFIPDMTKISLLISDDLIGQLFDVPFNWFALHTAGGTLVSILIGVTLVAPQERRRVFALLSIGAASHMLTDGLLQTPSGLSYAMFWPLTRWQPPTPGLYLSTQPWPTIATVMLALVVALITRYRRS